MSRNRDKEQGFKTSIGGQALIEGVMMRGPQKSAMSVRKPDGELHTEVWDNRPRTIWNRIPVVRGVVNMVSSLMAGYRCLMKSAEISTEGLEEEEPSRFEKWLEEKLGDHLSKVIMGVSAVLGLALAVVLFMFLPSFLVGLFRSFLPRWGLSLLEGLLKIGLFIGYLALVSLMPDMKRLFQYHGAVSATKPVFRWRAGVSSARCRFTPI